MFRSWLRAAAIGAVLAPAISRAQAATAAREMLDRYARAERMLTWNTGPLLYNDVISVTWLADSSRFWYLVSRPSGKEFMVVDPVANTVKPLFDHQRLAAALTRIDDGKKTVEPYKLPFTTFSFFNGEKTLRFKDGKRWIECDLASYVCSATTWKPRPASEVVSPDSQRVAFVSNHNVWVKPASGGDSTRLTTDGVRYDGYGDAARLPGALRSGEPRKPSIVWSPDSKKLLVARFDQRGVGFFPLYSSTSIRPEFYTFPYALPGDTTYDHTTRYVIDVADHTSRAVAPPSIGSAGFGGAAGTWDHDGRSFTYSDMTRADKVASIWRVDAATGARRRLGFDSSATYVDQTAWHVLPGGRGTIGMSERDGWKHLYLFDTTGQVRRQLTAGPWLVADVLRVNDTTGTIWFTAQGRENGRDPYYVKGYRVKVDGSAVQLVTPEDAEHTVRVSPGGKFIVDTWSRVDLPPETVLRSGDGRVIRVLEKGDATALFATGYRAPVPFTVKARDGKTDLYGALWLPNDFDSTKTYPVIDNIYPGPQLTTGPKGFVPNNNPNQLDAGYSQYSQAKALAELGFVVVNLDAMGTTHRSKAFRDYWYANMGDNGLPDHITGLRELAATRPYMDLTRVGIYGISGGGFASTDAILRYPDFFKVAVSTSGNHDNRSYNMHWGEKYTGVRVVDTAKKSDNFDSQANLNLVKNLKGKLFLIHGDMDDNVSPANTIRLVDALVKANKSFDMLIMPDKGHMLYYEPYVHKRMWDYFVANLRHEEPPADFVLHGAKETDVAQGLPGTGRDVLAAMHAAYVGRWFTSLTFTQKTTTTGADGASKEATWYESLRYTPASGTQLRIDTGEPSEGNGVLYSPDSLWAFRAGKQVAARLGGNALLPLIEGVYVQQVEQTERELTPTGVDLARDTRRGSWHDRAVWIVGASSDADTTSPQFWVDTATKAVVRAIFKPVPGAPVMDMRLEKLVPLAGGWLATRCEFFVAGKMVQAEDYSDWKANVALSPELFAPATWMTAPHWARKP